MPLPKRKTKRVSREKYDLSLSPFSQRLSQKDLAKLLGETKADLEVLATPRYKEHFLIRRSIQTSGKVRNLVYPTGRLRTIHERIKFHLGKIVQPGYMMSPRAGKSQRDNAYSHRKGVQFLTIDIKQFYPSTTRFMIRDSLMQQFKMHADVAGIIAHLATANDIACFGSPLTPVLATIVHRPMFNEIAKLCEENNLVYTVWVDDLTISGAQISGEFIDQLRKIISKNKLRSHKVKIRTGNRPVYITGIGVVGANLVAPRSYEIKCKELWQALDDAETLDEKEASATRLLALLGNIRYIVGASSVRGQKIASEMNSVRQKRAKSYRQEEKKNPTTFASGQDVKDTAEVIPSHSDLPF